MTYLTRYYAYFEGGSHHLLPRQPITFVVPCLRKFFDGLLTRTATFVSRKDLVSWVLLGLVYNAVVLGLGASAKTDGLEGSSSDVILEQLEEITNETSTIVPSSAGTTRLLK